MSFGRLSLRFILQCMAVTVTEPAFPLSRADAAIDRTAAEAPEVEVGGE